MDPMGLDKAFGQCRCCLNNGFHKNFTEPCDRNDIPKVYSELFRDCFDIMISTDTKLINLICASCICRLYDAVDFKTMVSECQERLLNKPVFIHVPNFGSEVDVKIEPKEEPPHFDEAFDNNGKVYGQCRCCMKNGFHKSLTEPCDRTGARKLHSELFQDCFNLSISTNTKLTNLICASCECRLYEAWEFKTSLVHSQQLLMCRNTRTETIYIEVPNSSISVKIEPEEIKQEPTDYEDAVENNVIKIGKTRTEKYKNYYNRKKAAEEAEKIRQGLSVKKPLKKTGAERTRAWRQRKKMLSQVNESAATEILSIPSTSNGTPPEPKSKDDISQKYQIVTEVAIERDTPSTSGQFNTTDQCTSPADELKLKEVLLEKYQYHLPINRDNSTSIDGSSAQDDKSTAKSKEYSCAICDFTTNKKRSYNSHIQAHERGATFICDFCSYISTKKQRLICHLRTHTGVTPYSCDICQKTFNHVANYKKHLKLHETLFCGQCEIVFTHREDLLEHIKAHTGGKPFACEMCGKRFAHRGAHKTHVRTHTGEKPFACVMCDKKFSHNSTLRDHIRTHTGEKPFSCDLCGKKFAHRHALTSHARMHSGEKPFACETCDRRFSTRSNLTMHDRKVHKGERPFACHICDKKLSRHTGLVQHLRTHSVNVPTSSLVPQPNNLKDPLHIPTEDQNPSFPNDTPSHGIKPLTPGFIGSIESKPKRQKKKTPSQSILKDQKPMFSNGTQSQPVYEDKKPILPNDTPSQFIYVPTEDRKRVFPNATPNDIRE